MIASKWEISDYGVMLTREMTLKNVYGVNTVKEAYILGKALTDRNKGSGELPYLYNDMYSFALQLYINNQTNYDIVYCAAPYIVINNVHYFLGEMDVSVNLLSVK